MARFGGAKVVLHRVGERGASFVEYAFLLALIVMFCLVAMTILGEDTRDGTSRSADSIAAAVN